MPLINADGNALSRYSVAMTGDIEDQLCSHLLREDEQEDLCLALYQQSTGAERYSGLLKEIILPRPGDTHIHGNVTFTGDYVLRASIAAAAKDCGVAILHSHPNGSGWQEMSKPDESAEASFANLVREITGHPLFGLTLAGRDRVWSARCWCHGLGNEISSDPCENIRVIRERLAVSWNPRVVGEYLADSSLTRTISCWGEEMQANISTLRILIVGVGSVGLDVATRLAATGVKHLAFMDFDSLEVINLDRMVGASHIDVWLARSKVELAAKLTKQCATFRDFKTTTIEGSICEPEFFRKALDYDLIFCSIDNHPWPRSILNSIAYTDLIPVIDGGIGIDPFPNGVGMRNATWRSHVIRPGRPCMACNGQLNLGKIFQDKEGLLEDEEYIAGLPVSQRGRSQNVAALSISASASLLAQFVSYLVAPASLGDPGPLRYSLSTHTLEHVQCESERYCPVEADSIQGDNRHILINDHPVAQQARDMRLCVSSRPINRVCRYVDEMVTNAFLQLNRAAKYRLSTRKIH